MTTNEAPHRTALARGRRTEIEAPPNLRMQNEARVASSVIPNNPIEIPNDGPIKLNRM